MNFDHLPEDCCAHILSFTSPGDACRSSLVSSSFRATADADSVWRKFLPSDHKQILSRFVSPIACSSSKDLFMKLCSPNLIDGGDKMFFIEKSTGKKCYMLSARDLSITWGSHPLYWTWRPCLESRFAEVAELRTIWWLEICGTTNTQILSPKTAYGAYLIIKIANRAYGLDTLPSEVSLEVGNSKSQSTIYLSKRNDSGKQASSEHEHFPKGSRWRVLDEDRSGGRGGERGDGWMEVEIGSFYNGECDEKDVRMSLREVKGVHLKGGLIVEGIELRPKQ
ncbi:F-box protein PP2-B15-like [Pyrus ussuriensis x Pyrus communis]|uniref:F-box protein PP2-B15-like n=1 Tax=Pyrus ussuriensis x Pyrus communis TaxID=2448454 RepID=A0A5N5H137_9ROSA|nr:F-box protein PP2-B15-like [Pyrus ussuriensis x Pyrus communis]